MYRDYFPPASHPFVARGLSALCLLLPALALAQPDAGTLRQQIEQDRPISLPSEAIPERPAEPAPLRDPDAVTVTVRNFRFAGNTLLSDEQLAPIVAPYLNRPLDLTELRKAAAAVAAAYREAGWVVRAYLPRQDIRDGTVTIQVVEAVFGGAAIDDEVVPRISSEHLLQMVERAQPRGEHLNANAIERALLLMDDLPGVAIKGNFSAGANQGETVLGLTLADEPLVRAEIGADNTGSRSTGSERLLANLSLNSPLGRGDLLATNYVHTRGSDYLRAAYTLPLGYDGWRAGVNASHLQYKLVQGDFKNLVKGSSGSYGLEASYPIIRSRMKNLYLQLNHDQKSFHNKFAGDTTTRYRISNTSVGLAGNLFDRLGGGGANSASLVWVSGERNNLVGTTDERFNKLRYSLRRQQVVTNQISLLAAFSGQWTNDTLDSSERFYLGGANGVRAYPASEIGGDAGQRLTLEARVRLPEGFTVIPFYDWGQAAVKDEKTLRLEGAGMALAWQGEQGITARLTWAHRLGSNPKPTITGKDQDGSLIKHRFWANLMVPF